MIAAKKTAARGRVKAMVLAAGRGERMRPLTDDRPKPMLEVGGKPLIQYHLEALARAGVREVIVNLAWRGERIREAFGDGARLGLAISYSDEGEQALETGGGIFKALPWLGPGPFLIVNGDIWTDFRPERLTLDAKALGRLVLVPNPPQHARGDFGLLHGEIVESGGPRWTYSGIAMLRPELFAGCTPGKFPLLPLLKRAIAAGRLRGELYDGAWFDIGTPERLAMLDRRLASVPTPGAL